MIYHISHIDLDGYACQIITKKHFKNKKIKFFNCDYGSEINNILNNILHDVKLNKYKQNKLIITDINLSMEVADFIQEIFINKHKFNVLLLDHHITGLDVAQKYPEWYILNKNICSAKITQEYFNVSSLQDFAEYVNIQDLWYDQHHFFSKANFIADIAYKGYEFPKIIEEEKYKYKIFTIKEVFYKIKKKWSIKRIQKNFIDIQEKFLLNSLPSSYIKNQNISIEHKFVKYIYEKIKNKPHKIIHIDNSKGFVFFELGLNIFQQVAHMFLKDFPNIDFVIHISKYGRLSIRSIGQEKHKNVSYLAKKYFYGGGHFNASGGSLFNHQFKEISSETEAILIVYNLLNQINSIKLIQIEPHNEFLFELLEKHKNGKLYTFNNKLFILLNDNNVFKLINVISNNIIVFDNKIKNYSLDEILLKFQEALYISD